MWDTQVNLGVFLSFNAKVRRTDMLVVPRFAHHQELRRSETGCRSYGALGSIKYRQLPTFRCLRSCENHYNDPIRALNSLNSLYGNGCRQLNSNSSVSRSEYSCSNVSAKEPITSATVPSCEKTRTRSAASRSSVGYW